MRTGTDLARPDTEAASESSQMSNTNRFDRHRRVVLTFFTLFLVLAADFVGKRIYEVYKERTHPDLDKRFRVRSPIYHHDLKSNVSVEGARWGDQTYSIHTDSLGFRDAVVREVPLTNSRPRVLFIGDSFTEAPVSWEESFVGIIARDFERRGVDVLNAGVVSYSPSIYYAKCRHLLETVGLRVQEIVVFIDISDARDDGLNYELAPDGTVRSLTSPVPGWIKRNSLLFAEGVRAWERWSSRGPVGNGGPQVVRGYEGAWTWDQRSYEDFGRKAEVRMVRNMDALLALSRKHGIGLTIAFYPWPAQLFHTEVPCRSRQLWTRWAQENRVPFLDLYPAFQRVPWEEAVKRYFIPGDVHWNPAGNALVAAEFLDAVNRGVVPSPRTNGPAR
ncbi:MAG: hypothetical protein U1G08_03650 [Verrucomicrobiota bacterium]